jgi:hypothetical protein
VPYENLAIMLGRPPSVDPVASTARVGEVGRAGYCFHQNGALETALTDLGFRVSRRGGHVWTSVDDRWTGTLNSLAVRVRFEPDAQGRVLGYFDSLQQNLLNLPMKEAHLAGTKLTFSLSVGAKYSGDLAAGTLTGEWSQPGLPKPLPLVLTREK